MAIVYDTYPTAPSTVSTLFTLIYCMFVNLPSINGSKKINKEEKNKNKFLK